MCSLLMGEKQHNMLCHLVLKQTEKKLSNNANTRKGQSLRITVAWAGNISASNPVLDGQCRCVDAANNT